MWNCNCNGETSSHKFEEALHITVGAAVRNYTGQ